MSVQVAAIILMMAGNIVLGAVALLPRSNQPIPWRTLVIWRSADYKMTGMQWIDGAVTKKQAENITPTMDGMSVMETFTVPGRPFDAEWVQSLPPGAHIDLN